MTDFNTYESGQEISRPFELYTFTIGSAVYRYTSAEDSITESADTFTPVNIRRSKLRGGGPDSRTEALVLSLPGSNTIVKRYISSVPGVKADVVIERMQRDDTSEEVIRIFEGRITSVAFEDNGRRAKVEVKPRVSAQSRPVPRFTYQGLCNHVLYDGACGADDTDPTYRLSSATVTAESGNTITVSGASAYTDGWFTGGYVESGDDYRLVIDHVGDLLTLHLPFATSVDGIAVNVFAGCSHNIATCKSKFNNVVNFGGFAFVPTKNIFETGLD